MTSSSSSSSFIRLSPRPFSSLPPHASLSESSSPLSSPSATSRPDLSSFLHSILSEARALVTSTTNPNSFHPNPKLRTSSPASAKVQVLTGSRDTDFWVCRRSVHVDASRDGTASWDEFRRGLRENHSQNEMEYTPSVSAVKTLVQWETVEELDGGWSEIDTHINLITHTFRPAFLVSPRSFISLVIVAGFSDTKGFVTVQIPLTHQPAQLIPAALRNTIVSSVPRNTVFAAYSSVESVAPLPSGETEWIMATTSDAGGLIPQWVQRSWTMGGVPKAVVADVGLFIGWTARNRKR